MAFNTILILVGLIPSWLLLSSHIFLPDTLTFERLKIFKVTLESLLTTLLVSTLGFKVVSTWYKNSTSPLIFSSETKVNVPSLFIVKTPCLTPSFEISYVFSLTFLVLLFSITTILSNTLTLPSVIKFSFKSLSNTLSPFIVDSA